MVGYTNMFQFVEVKMRGTRDLRIGKYSKSGGGIDPI